MSIRTQTWSEPKLSWDNPEMTNSHLKSRRNDQYSPDIAQKWPTSTLKPLKWLICYENSKKNAKETTQNGTKTIENDLKTAENKPHQTPTGPCYTEAHLENQGAYSLRSLTAPWFSRWASVTYFYFLPVSVGLGSTSWYTMTLVKYGILRTPRHTFVHV